MLRRPRERGKICRLTLFLSCLSATTLAQSAPASWPQKLPLTLRQAVLLALQQNPQQIIALLQVQQSGRDSQIARAPLLPQVDLYATGGVSQYNFQSVERLPAPKPAGRYQIFEGGTTCWAWEIAINLPAIRAWNYLDPAGGQDLPTNCAFFARHAASNLSAAELSLEIGESL
jgi:outer membrane efflux protein